MECCRNPTVGEWHFPNGGAVEIEIGATTFYRNRGAAGTGTVNLNRVDDNVLMPTGLFCCLVPDATGVDQTVCANIGES